MIVSFLVSMSDANGGENAQNMTLHTAGKKESDEPNGKADTSTCSVQ
jgi:hypothetical protein